MLDFNNLPKRTASHKLLRDKVFNIAEKVKYDRYQSKISSMVHNFWINGLLLHWQINLLVQILSTVL